MTDGKPRSTRLTVGDLLNQKGESLQLESVSGDAGLEPCERAPQRRDVGRVHASAAIDVAAGRGERGSGKEPPRQHESHDRRANRKHRAER